MSMTYSIHDLPELPLEALLQGGKLEHVGTEPVLTVTRPRPPRPTPPLPPTAAIKKGEFVVRKYLTQVTYPRVTCYPASELADATVTRVFTALQHAADVRSPIVNDPGQFYKLTSHVGSLTSPFFCHVHHGPWSATVFEQEACETKVPSLWTLFVVSVPEIVLAWYGNWEDVPPYPSLHVIKGDLYQCGEVRHCCPGFTWCEKTKSCLDDAFKCDDSTTTV